MLNNEIENSLYMQLKKDMKKGNKKQKREYIPVALFSKPEELVIDSYVSTRRRGKNLIVLLGNIFK